MSPSACAELGRDAFPSFTKTGLLLSIRIPGDCHLGDRWVCCQVGGKDLATASSGKPRNYSQGRGGRRQERCWPCLSTPQLSKDPERLQTPIPAQRQSTRQRTMDKHQAITSPSLFLLTRVLHPEGATWCSRTIGAPQTDPGSDLQAAPLQTQQASFLFCPKCGCE